MRHDYSFYLFSKLFDVFIKQDYEYDLMYQDISNLFFLYKHSKYNNENVGEYECITGFFKDNLEYIKTQEYLIDIEEIKNKLKN